MGDETVLDDVESEGLADSEIRIEAPKEPEVDPIHYRDVESLLFKGFLVKPAEINGVRFLFKSMNHHEFENLQWISGGVANEAYYNTFLSYCVFMVDGANILPERERWVSEFEQMFSSMSTPAKAKIVHQMAEVNRKASNAITLTEAYQMEKISRFRWAQFKGLEMMSSSCTGIEGTSKLGMNYAQLVWRALNYYEDLRDSGEREWENAKFIGSCFAGKEIRKIYSQDRDRRQKEAQERVQRKDQIIRQVLLGEDLTKDQTRGQVTMIVARTVEELAEQLQKDLRGERDWHDEVVAREEDKIREGIKAREEQVRTIQQAREGEPLAVGTTDLSKGLSSEEVRERLTRKRQLEAQRLASRVVNPELSDERVHDFVRKHLTVDETTENKSSVGVSDRDPSNAVPIVPPRTPGVPFRRS
jgi:hypothetical protein